MNCAVSALAIGVMIGTAAAQDVTLRMHHLLPGQANVPANILEPWAISIEEASEEWIEVQRFRCMQLGGSPPQLIDGTADTIWTAAGHTPDRFSYTEVFEPSFMMKNSNAEAASRAFWILVQDTMLDDFSDFRVLGLWVHGAGLIHSSDPVETVGKLNGMKLRASGPTTNTLFSNLGASPVGMPVSTVPEALSRGYTPHTVMILILVFYLIMGCLMDSLSMILLTIPIRATSRAVMWFFMSDLIRVAILAALPAITLFLST